MRFPLSRLAVAGVTALALFATAVSATASATGAHDDAPKPTIVLVHGAWADSSSWDPVIERLRHDGYPVRAIADPLQGLTSDTAYVTSYLSTIDGPKVLVGHSYGGAVITNAATAVAGVKSLVYIAGFIPAKGETVGELAAKSVPPLPLISTEVPGGTEVVIDPAQFRAAFAGDLDPSAAADLATTQRPANTRAVTDASVTEGFRTIPSWALVTRQDHAISPDVQRFMTTRAHARTTEVDASHAVMLSRPDAVTGLIEQAAR
ncbi:pimeloyl-ACP methyl ester carboxylesterase [Amycolatopsis bartoniae]|uniref:Alpha/beta hydrolase n=1 Tax=Amycolatopsis bartoniae TaxID=941986 RepID=A0A8H9M771_9PSEU|nr:alpha/beta hydrolase [Amycolatopsis bartoniae]MBB2939867.1 pimeloyl-ACP methyl ester carboxylesterase [Amycolatopsis bartoniae]TVT10025.1 alpha/beta hydrolase [Amycolatopsis bartoniae]GHF31679.1 alpha/beta hydrolase [Amycolatopsis bartoniae]